MPIYEYKCTKCGAVFEKERKRQKKDSHTQCPKCKSAKVDRLPPSGVGAQFKGPGFYVNGG